MNSLLKKIILFISIFSSCFGFSAIAGIEQSRVSEGINGCECSFWELKSETPQGNYTLLQDYSEHSILVHTSQWNEYKLLVSQGSPEVIDVWGDEYSYEYEDTDYFKGFYLITGYRLKGQKNVNLPKDKYIKITDPYNCDHLSILKYLGKTLDSNTLLDVNKYKAEVESKVKEEVEKKYGTAEERAKKQAEQESKEAIYDDFKEALNEYNETYLSTKEMMSATSEAASKAREIKDNIKEKIKKISSDNHAIDSNVHGAYDKFMVEYNKTKDSNSIFDLGITIMKMIMEGEYGTNWDPAYIKCMKENNGNWTSHTTMNVKWTKGDGLIHKFNISEESFGLKYLYGWILTNEEYNQILSEVKTRCVESYEELISTKYPKALGDERKQIWHRYSIYIGVAAFRNELDSFCKEYEKTIEANQDAIDKRNANKEEVYNKLEEYDKE